MTKAKPDPNEELRLEQQRAAAYRTTADRYRQLLAETTTPALAEHLREMITRCEANGARGRGERVARALQLAGDVAERGTEIAAD